MILRGASDLVQRVLKTLLPRKDVPFGGLNDYLLDFGSQTPKTEILDPWIGLSSVNDNRFKYLTWTLLRFHESFAGDSQSGGLTIDFLEKSNMADGGRIES